MIAYLVHTGVVSDSRVGRMGITSSDSARYHSDTGVEMSCTSLSFRMSPNEVRTALFSPLTFHIGTGGDHGIGLIVHAGKVAGNEEVGVTEKR